MKPAFLRPYRSRGAAIASSMLIAISASLVLVVSPANAYNRSGCMWWTDTPTYQTPSGTYETPTVNAKSAWNNSGAHIYFIGTTLPGSKDIKIRAVNEGANHVDAHADWYCSGNKSTSGSATYNTYYTSGYTTTGRQQVMVHELGHLLGLGHAGGASCSGQPIMYSNSSRYFTCGHYAPQADDVAGVNSYGY